MLRVIHAYDIKPGVDERSFVEGLDGQLDQITKRFGWLHRAEDVDLPRRVRGNL